MAGQTISLDAIVRAELAIEIMNQARGLVSECVAAIEADDPAGADPAPWPLADDSQPEIRRSPEIAPMH